MLGLPLTPIWKVLAKNSLTGYRYYLGELVDGQVFESLCAELYTDFMAQFGCGYYRDVSLHNAFKMASRSKSIEGVVSENGK